MSWSDLTGADWAAATVAIPHTTSTETAACRNNVFIMARIVDRGVGRRKSAVSLAAYLRGVGRAEAADPRAGGPHNSSLRPDVWREIDRWIDALVATPLPASPSARAG